MDAHTAQAMRDHIFISYSHAERLWDVATGACYAILVHLPQGWVAYTPDGCYKLGGDIGGGFWHVIGLCRFEPGELDPYLPTPLRLPDDVILVPAAPHEQRR